MDAKKYKYKSSLQCPEEADEEERRNEDPWSPISTTKTVDESVIDKFISYPEAELKTKIDASEMYQDVSKIQ